MTEKPTPIRPAVQAASDLIDALVALNDQTARLEAATDASPILDTQAQVDAIALIQELRYRLGLVESTLATALGKAEGVIQGNLSDGRQFTLKRTQDRKEWDHDDWKRDARRAVVQGVLKDRELAIMDLETGEVGDTSLSGLLYEAVAQAQEVHGSTAPRSTSLKRLGLYASDYCTSSPGGWKLNAIKAEPKPDTTTEKDA